MRRKNTELVRTLQELKLTLAIAESVTCGLAAHQLTMVRGTTDVLRGAIVCYQPEMKTELLNVSPTLIKKHTAESQAVTDALARNLPKLMKADIHAAITGLAAGGGSETRAKPVGTIYLSVYFRDRMVGERRNFRGTPLDIKRKACEALYDLVLKIVRKA